MNLAKLHLTEDFAEFGPRLHREAPGRPVQGALTCWIPTDPTASASALPMRGSSARRRCSASAIRRTKRAIITDQLIDNALCGYRFASLPRILAIAEDAKTAKPRTPVRIVRETPVSALVDGGNKVGYVAAFRGAEIAVAKAKASGIAIVGVHNSYYSGRNAYYVEHIVRAGLVAIHTASARPHVLPPGGRRPALGTNPFSIGFPSANGPVIYDIGTASLMWGEVLLMARLGQALPEGVGFDADGQADARCARGGADGGVTPFGGHKGYGLSFAIQALGLLAGAALPRGDVQDYGFLFIAIDPAVMLPEGISRAAGGACRAHQGDAAPAWGR